MKWIPRMGVLGWVFFAGMIASQATTLIHLDLEDLVEQADVILRAKVASVKVQVHAGEVEVPFTEVRLLPLEIFKGSSQIVNHPDFVLHLPGGQTEHLQLHISASGSFLPGSEVVVFLEATEASHFVLLGMTQGKFDLVTDPETHTKMAKREIAGLNTLVPSKNGVFYSGAVQGTSDSELPYELLKTIIQSP